MKPLAEILQALKAPLPQGALATRKQGGQNITYVPWYNVAELLDRHAPGWQWQVVSVQVCGNHLVLVGRLIVPTADGPIVREATGSELLEVSGYGDPASNAEAMAFRRAAAKFGLGLYLYRKQPARP